jgi:hypothetical protein
MRSTTAAGRALVAVMALGLAIGLAGCDGGAPQATPTTSGPVEADPFSIRVGDCIADELAEGEVLRIPVVDCADPHVAEAYHSEDLPDGEYPGLEKVKQEAVKACLAQFEPFAGISYDTSERLDFAWYYPTEGSWSTGDREILCLLVQIDPATGDRVETTGTLKDFGK